MIQHALDIITKQYCKLSDEAIVDLKANLSLLEVLKGTQLVKEGQYSDDLYFIVKGATRAYYLKDGKDITDWFAFENDFICAIKSYFLFIPSPHFVEVIEDSVLVVFKRDKMQKLCDNHHDIERLARIGTTKTMLQLQHRVVSLQFETAHQRYQNILEIYPQIELRASLGQISSFLGITQETLSRIRANYRKRI